MNATTWLSSKLNLLRNSASVAVDATKQGVHNLEPGVPDSLPHGLTRIKGLASQLLFNTFLRKENKLIVFQIEQRHCKMLQQASH